MDSRRATVAGVRFSVLLIGSVIGWCAVAVARGCCSSSFFSNIEALSITEPQLLTSIGGESRVSDDSGVNVELLSFGLTTGAWLVGVVDVDKSSLIVSSRFIAAPPPWTVNSGELVSGVFCGVWAPSGELIGLVADESGDTSDDVDERAGELGCTKDCVVVVVVFVLFKQLLLLLVFL